MTASKGTYEFGEWRVDPTERLLLRRGSPVALTPKAFETLLLLVENAGHLVTKDEFMTRVWPDAFVAEAALPQNISQLRKTLASSGSTIENVPKRGYRLLGPVRFVAPNSPAIAEPVESAVSPKASPVNGERFRNPIPGEATNREALTATHVGWSSRAVRIAGLSITLAVAILTSFGVLRHVRAARASNNAVAYPGIELAERQPAPEITPLISLSGEQSMPAFSPDGSRVAFVWQNPQPKRSGIYAAIVGSQNLLRLTSDRNDVCPTWSPDGRYVAFLRHSQDKFSISMVSALGGPEHQLYSGLRLLWAGPEGLSFSPDGKWLAFAEAESEARTSAIRMVSVEDSSVRSLTSPPAGYHDAAPALSPDGERLAFVRSTGPIFLDEIYVVSLPGGEPRQLTFDHHRVFGAPVWTKDGKDILFASNRAGMKSLWRISAAGGTPQPVLGPGPVADHPSISPSSGELAYEYSVENENLWRVDVKNAGHGGQPSPLFSSKTSSLMPQFSPDGSKVAFEGDRSGYEEIWICDPDGSNSVQITRLERFSGTPRWSPDGRRLVFDSRREQHSGIYTVEVADGVVRQVPTFSDADSVVPSWSHDGRWIYFASDHGGRIFHVWKVPVNGGPPVQLTKSSGFAALESADGQHVFYTRLSTPGIWRVPSGGGPEISVWPGSGPDNWGNWAVTTDAVYFIDSQPGAKAVIERMDLKTRNISHVATLARPSFYGLTVSPGGSVIYSQRDREEHDVVVTKLFR